MFMDAKVKISLVILVLSIGTAHAETIINNYSTAAPTEAPAAAPPPPPSGCNQGNASNGGVSPGTYSSQNYDGTYSQVYTTGDKKPYIVDNNCNQPTIQPYISPNMPNGNGTNNTGTSGMMTPNQIQQHQGR